MYYYVSEREYCTASNGYPFEALQTPGYYAVLPITMRKINAHIACDAAPELLFLSSSETLWSILWPTSCASSSSCCTMSSCFLNTLLATTSRKIARDYFYGAVARSESATRSGHY
jgi:hypothetical protein